MVGGGGGAVVGGLVVGGAVVGGGVVGGGVGAGSSSRHFGRSFKSSLNLFLEATVSSSIFLASFLNCVKAATPHS